MKLTEKVCGGEVSCATVAARVFSSVLGPQAASLESKSLRELQQLLS